MNIKGKICIGYTASSILLMIFLSLYRPMFLDNLNPNLKIFIYFYIVQLVPIALFYGYEIILKKFNGASFYTEKYKRSESFIVQLKEMVVFISVRAILFFIGCSTQLVTMKDYGYNFQSSVYSIIYALIILLVNYETTFYFIHYASHKYKSLYKLCHYKHHENLKNVWSTLYSAHYLDNLLISLGYVVGLILFSKIVPISYEAIYFSMFLVSYIEIAGHSDIEGSRLMGYTEAPKILNTIACHALHHFRYKENMGLTTRFWDRLMKTESPDYEEIMVKMLKGEVLEEIIKTKSSKKPKIEKN